MLNNIRIGYRLAVGFCVVIAFMIATIALNISQMAANQAQLKQIVKVANVRVQLANQMIDNAREVALAVRNTIILRYSKAPSESVLKMRDNWADQWDKYHQNIAEAKKLIIADDATGLDLCNKVVSTGDIAQKSTAKAIELVLAGKEKEATVFVFATAYPSVQKWIEANQEFIKHNDERIAFHYDEANKAQARARTIMLVLGAMAITAAALLAILLTLGITRPLQASVQAANAIATRDLRVDVAAYAKRGDELGDLMRSFGTMGQVLRDQLQGIMDGVNTLSSSSNEILAATMQVATGTTETATAISETTATVEEVRQAAQLSSDKAKNVADNAQQVAQVSQTGKKAVEETVTGMEHVRVQMDAIAQTIVRLSEQSQSIGGIIASVTDLADQSNLLAVNAAIEAARAGEHGKGFAVVAQEIKNLAEQSKQATTQVRNILNDVQKATSAAVMATEQGAKAVDAGVRQSGQAGDAIRVLADRTGEAARAAVQIVASSQQQVVGMNQIGVAMETINQAGTQTAASMKQAEVAARNLHEIGQKLKDSVEKFKV